MGDIDTFVPLVCECQTYGWGKVGAESQVAQLVKSGQGLEIEDSTPYAELWMGTHKNGPSKVSSGVLLGDWIGSKPGVLGPEVEEKFGAVLPFLFRVLSINKSLSIQAHPEKQHAAILHENHPQIYKDANHKPEMAIALTKFEALCGFRPLEEIVGFLQGNT